jgi:hypothetical protein
MNSGPSNAIRRPYELRDWTFVLGLPTSPAEFDHAKAYGEFCLLPPPLLTFDAYHAAFLTAFERHIAPLARAGLSILRYPTARQYAGLLRGRNPTVLFTHSDGANLEFRDGMIPFAQVVESVETRFEGIAEICACAPHGLQELIKSRAPNCLTKVSAAVLSSGLWMAYYGLFLSTFTPRANTFGDACLQADAVLKKLGRG